MTKRTSFFLLFSVLTLTLAGCSSSSVVATVGSEKLSLQEFEDTYSKNNGGWDASASSSLEDRQRFLDLIIKFKLKVLEAKDQGLMSDTAIQNELDSYRLSVAQTYMLEKELVEPHLKEMYERKREEIRASHILFRLAPNALPPDTLAAYTKAIRVIGMIPRRGFDTLAAGYSEDQSATFNKGDLGFFSVGRMVPEFENACYSLRAGEYTTLPVRSQFGYHVIKVTARQPNTGSVRIHHILKRFSQDGRDTASIRDTMLAVYRRIQNGLSFEKAATQYSDDVGSASRGGELGWYERGVLPQDMGSLLFSARIDSVLPPFRANYGYHIFRVTERKAIAPLEDFEKEFRQQYQQLRYDRDYKEYVTKLTRMYNLRIDTTRVFRVAQYAASARSATDSAWITRVPRDVLTLQVMTVGKRTLTGDDFLRRARPSGEAQSVPESHDSLVFLANQIGTSLAIEEHALSATDRHPAFSRLMQEYLEGILLYRIEQDEIWKKVVVNDSALRPFYEMNKEKYRWPDRINVAEIFVLSDSVARRAYWKLQYGEDFLSVAEEFTTRSGFREKLGVWGYQPLTMNELTTRASTMTTDSITAPFKYQNGWSIIKLLGRDAARMKTFEEAGPELVSAYQEQAAKHREAEWIESIRRKYPVALNKDVLTQAFKVKRLDVP